MFKRLFSWLGEDDARLADYFIGLILLTGVVLLIYQLFKIGQEHLRVIF